MSSGAGVNEESQYPEPYVVPPQRSHKQTFIILHGRGDQGENFGASLIWTVSGQKNSRARLQSIFPDAKFVFPTAALRRAKGFNNSKINQWFDLGSITEQTEREQLQYDGLRETTALIHSILREEIACVGAENVVLWGLSQGCAVSLTALMLWEGERIGAYVGMCGWFPLRPKLESFLEDMKEHAEGNRGDVAFTDEAAALEEASTEQTNDERRRTGSEDQLARGGRSTTSLTAEQETVKHLADIIDMAYIPDVPSMMFQKVPMLLAHGKLDRTVPMYMGKEAVDFLEKMGATAGFNEYGDLGHWYSSDMLKDLAAFLQEKLQTGTRKTREIVGTAISVDELHRSSLA